MASKKQSIIYVLKVLEKYTDENHFLTQKEIIDKVYEEYDIELERKSIASSIKSLIELDYDINKKQKGGYALLSRLIDKSQLNYLIDAIYSSHNITKENANELIKNITSIFSEYAQKNTYQLHSNSLVYRTDNKQIFYNIELLNEAIKNKKKVSFQYLGFNNSGEKTVKYDGFRYIISPYYLINNFGRYYVIGNYNKKYGSITTFRIDYIVNIQIEEYDYIPITEFKDELGNFSIDKYINEHIYLFGGKVINATLEIEKPSSLIYIYDWFGEKTIIKNKDRKFIINITCDENALLYWIMQYGEEAKVISPESLIKKVITNSKQILTNHLDKD